MAIEIVSFPIKHGGSFHSFLYVYQSQSRLLAKDHPIGIQKRIIAFLGLMAVKMGIPV